jgi:hypothetical protein
MARAVLLVLSIAAIALGTVAAFGATRFLSAPQSADLAVCFLIFGLGFIVLGIGYARDALRRNRTQPRRR